MIRQHSIEAGASLRMETLLARFRELIYCTHDLVRQQALYFLEGIHEQHDSGNCP